MITMLLPQCSLLVMSIEAQKNGISGFKFVFDLAEEWYAWQKLPLSLPCGRCKKLCRSPKNIYLQQALQRSSRGQRKSLILIGCLHGKQVACLPETKEYLEGIIYRSENVK